MAQKLIICSTCKFSAERAFDDDGQTGGEVLAQHIEAARTRRHMDIEVVRHPCLWSCKQSCAIQLQDENRTGYHAGGFSPDHPTAEAILDWVAAHSRTADGNVPFAEWPEAMKGHFVARLPNIMKAEELDD